MSGFDAMLAGRPGRLVGGPRPVPLDPARWHRPPDRDDRSLLRRCTGPTLDVGCGPGRLTAALARHGVPALGIDVSALAVRLAHARGAVALRRDVFDALPAEGRWRHVLLTDGNIGIGGDPAALLDRCAALLAPQGRVLVELDPLAVGVCRWTARVDTGDRFGDPFPWATVGADAIAALAGRAGLRVHRTWCGRTGAYAELRAPRHGRPRPTARPGRSSGGASRRSSWSRA